MNYGLGFVIEGLVAVLLLVTIGYCMVLNDRLKRLRADEHSLRATIAELITATEIAERAVAGLKTTAHECEDTLGERLKSAEHLCTDLSRQAKAGEMILSRLSRVIAEARPRLEAIPETTADAAPDPKAVAAAARSFADRLRERVGALAA
ncbi:MAG: hypothetical protein QOG83_3553 [Alphaproteobacteria bacterium]|nr:hypothetical protein [Alphaproteobacteria bacterium]